MSLLLLDDTSVLRVASEILFVYITMPSSSLIPS
jgi:hypothetical protein